MELKVNFGIINLFATHLFLIHRVELKVILSLSKKFLSKYKFLIHRVELKEFLGRAVGLGYRTFLIHRVELKVW